MKKLMCLLLAGLMLVSCVACDDDADELSVKKVDTVEEKPAPEPDEPAEEPEKPVEEPEKAKTTEETGDKKSGSSSFNFGTEEIKISPVKPVEAANAKFDFTVENFDENLAANLTEVDLKMLGQLDDESKMKILKTKADILKKLVELIKKHDIEVSVNEMTGELVLNSSILFDNDKSDVSEKGKSVLRKFTTIYATVVCESQYSNLISKIIVEGHTDTNGTYDYNKKLSLKRAESVRDACLADEVKISDNARKKLEKCTEVAGCSYDRPVKDAKGNVDMDASRRVTFRFIFDAKALMGSK